MEPLFIKCTGPKCIQDRLILRNFSEQLYERASMINCFCNDENYNLPFFVEQVEYSKLTHYTKSFLINDFLLAEFVNIDVVFKSIGKAKLLIK